jgi:hypothetical protein
MASEKQIVANRANGGRSKGPKTAAGRLKSSRNAFRHGLSGPMRPDPVTSMKIDAIARANWRRCSCGSVSIRSRFCPRPA